MKQEIFALDYDSNAIITKFKWVWHEIELIEEEVNRTEGLLWFKKHVHSREDLLNHQGFKKIGAMIGTISRDISEWNKAGKLSQGGKTTYVIRKEDVIDRICQVKIQITRRRDTWWEEAIIALNFFVETIKLCLEDLIMTLPEPTPKLFVLVKSLIAKKKQLPQISSNNFFLEHKDNTPRLDEI